MLAVFGFRVFPQRDVTVLSNGQAYRVQATFDPRAEGLAAAGIRLGAGDRVVSASGGNVASVAVQRARDVTIEADGRTVAVRTQAATVGGAIAEAGLDLHPEDRIYADGQLTNERGPLAAALYASAAVPGAGDAQPQVRLTVVRARPVTVLVDSLPVQVSSSAATVEQMLGELGMTVREGDLVRPSLTAPVTAGMVVRLAKGRTITVKLDGKEQSVYTLASTVGDVIRLLNVDPSTIDSVSSPVDAPTFTGMSLTIARTIVVEEQAQDAIPPSASYEDDPNAPVGQDRVVEGKPGVRTHRYSVTYKNGEAVSRVEIGNATVTQVPVPTRYIRGTKVVPNASRPMLDAPGYNGAYRTKVTMVTTWYNASHGGRPASDPNYGRTASGAMLEKGICAVDPSVYTFGTRFFVPGYGMCVAADTGGLITGNHLDLGFPDSAGDPGWGSKTIEVYVLD